MTSAAALDLAVFEQRWDRARDRLTANNLDALYVSAGPTFTWLSGYSPHAGGWPDFASALFLPASGEPAMLISEMHNQILDRDMCAVRQVFTYVDGQDPRPMLANAIEAAGLKSAKVAIDNSLWVSDLELVQSAAPDTRLVRSDLFETLRALKDPAEIERLRQSAKCQDTAFATAADVMRSGTDLGEAEAAMRIAMMKHGCNAINLLGVFKSPRPRTFQPNELIDIDFGTAVCAGYSIDSSRNVFFGEPSKELLKQWELVEKAYQAAMAAVRPGALARDVHRAGAAVIEDGGYRQTWKMGHGVGLSNGHEPPWLQDRSETVLEPGMTFTIDPGFFVARDLPLHIEDTVLVTDDGVEALNRFPRNLIIVD